ncbi:hypothetical protein AB0G88_40970, partial [Streptomyces noursei]
GEVIGAVQFEEETDPEFRRAGTRTSRSFLPCGADDESHEPELVVRSLPFRRGKHISSRAQIAAMTCDSDLDACRVASRS